ncbi:MAG: PaaI family thioesterase [Hyphomonadaceae bacterium]|nr:PaaI family thioesterase [Hyphomonadaceae bacterium]
MTPKPMSREDLLALSGLEAMRGIAEGRFAPPPISQTMGFFLRKVEDGYALFEGTLSEKLLNPLGIVHGGVALTLIDSCCGCSAHTTLPAGVGYTTVETKVNFVRAITPDVGVVCAEGRVVARGRTIITAEGKLVDRAGKLYAHGTSTLLVFQPKGE